MPLAHDYVKDDLQLESQTGRIGLQIIATLIGGVLLVCSFCASLLFDSPAHADILAARRIYSHKRNRDG